MQRELEQERSGSSSDEDDASLVSGLMCVGVSLGRVCGGESWVHQTLPICPAQIALTMLKFEASQSLV